MKRFFHVGVTGTLGGLLAVGLLFLIFAPGSYKLFFQRGTKPGPPIDRIEAFVAGDKFPELNLRSVDGEQFRLSAHPYKVLLVNFFTSW